MIVERYPVSLPAPKPRAARSPGVHVSSVIKMMAMEKGILKPRQLEVLSLVDVRAQEEWWNGLNPGDQLRIALGLAWEEWYIPQMQEMMGIIDHPGEMQVDGIFMTSDGESLDIVLTDSSQQRFVPAVHEVKLTYKSINTCYDIAAQFMWVSQLKAYCKGKDTRIAYLHVLFVAGDHSRPITPIRCTWRIEFTQLEIDDFWETVTDYVREHSA